MHSNVCTETCAHASFIPPALPTVSVLCPYNILQITPHQMEYFWKDDVEFTCLQSCSPGIPSALCQPSLFCDSSETSVFPEESQMAMLNSCNYSSYALDRVVTTELAGRNLSCGGWDRSGNLNLSHPLIISVKRGELCCH